MRPDIHGSVRGPASVSAVVVSYNTRDWLVRCLSALTSIGIDTAVVDNASSDGSAEVVAREFPQISLLPLTENRGFGAAANEAIRHIDTSYVLLLNADAWPRGNPLPRLLAVAEEQPQVAVVAPGLVDVDHVPQRSVFGYPRRPLSLALYVAFPGAVSRAFRAWQAARPRRRGESPRTSTCLPVQGNDFPAGAALLLRRSAFEAIGGFDESFFMYSEETDLCLRLREAGWRIVHCPSEEFVHVGGASTRQQHREMHREQIVSHLRFIAKHAGEGAAIRALRLSVIALRLRRTLTPEATALRDDAEWLAGVQLGSLLRPRNARV